MVDGFEPDGTREAEPADRLRARAREHLGRGAWEAAARAFAESRRVAEESGDIARMGRAENGLAAVEFHRGEWRLARRHWRRARALAGRSGDHQLLADVENNEGAILCARGEHREAEKCFRRALEAYRRLGRELEEAQSLNNLGMALAEQGRHAEAGEAYERALPAIDASGDAALRVELLINRARLSIDMGDLARGRTIGERAWESVKSRPPDGLSASVLALLGEVARSQSDPVGATRLLKRALDHCSDGRAPLVEATTWAEIGTLYWDQGQRERALETWRFSRERFLRLGALAEAERLARRIEEGRKSPAA